MSYIFVNLTNSIGFASDITHRVWPLSQVAFLCRYCVDSGLLLSARVPVMEP